MLSSKIIPRNCFACLRDSTDEYLIFARTVWKMCVSTCKSRFFSLNILLFVLLLFLFSSVFRRMKNVHHSFRTEIYEDMYIIKYITKRYNGNDWTVYRRIFCKWDEIAEDPECHSEVVKARSQLLSRQKFQKRRKPPSIDRCSLCEAGPFLCRTGTRFEF